MRTTTLFIFLSIAGFHSLFAQSMFRSEAPPLSPYDSIMLASLPELEDLPVLKSNELPYSLDNSRLKYYRPIYEQVSNECGQVSGIAYNFTYEINRLRDLPADIPDNQYPPHFTYNFMNGGFGWFGASYFHSFEILRTLGCPSVETYGGMAAGGESRWMNGYYNYLSAMSNRVREVYQIKAGTEAGLMQLKHWLHNHLEGSEVGGVASFYANSPWNITSLAEGTPEAGKKVITYWAGNPTHAMTITGYNDSIRYDYNEDGQYTNHIDINSDGEVNMKDWEIGGLVFADGWQGGINFGDSGRCYMMYKTLADDLYDGGIWNNAVHVLDVKSIEKPRLVAKIQLTHDRRGMLRIRLGVASDLNATQADYSISFPVFNFQGGNQYMQGGYTPDEHKTIEFGLDITPLLGRNATNMPEKFFLMIDERDPEGTGSGSIDHFSVIDYTEIYPVESSWDSDPIPILDNSTTIASLLPAEGLEVMSITTDELPAAVVGEPYSIQLESSGGIAPVEWNLLHTCSEESFQSDVDTTGIDIEPDYYNYGNVAYALPFSFPLYGEYYDTIFIHSRGLVMFENTNYPWPYLRDCELLIRNTKCIAPLLAKYLVIELDSGHRMWVKESENMISIGWKARIADPNYSATVEFALEMHESGKIQFIYGSEIEGHKTLWSCGVSKGNKQDYFIPSITENTTIEAGSALRFLISPLPDEMHLSPDGIFSGTPASYYQELPITFCAEDDDHCRTVRVLKFSATDLGLDEHAGSGSEITTYPNPFSRSISIRIESDISINTCRIYNIEGRLIRTLAARQELKSGDVLSWDGCDMESNKCPAGIYFLRMDTGKKMISKKLVYTGR